MTIYIILNKNIKYVVIQLSYNIKEYDYLSFK